jgi:DNA polymerase elongation subunit (family B)
MKILLLDCETSPNQAFVWGLFDQTIPITAIKESSSVLCYAAKWYGGKTIFFDSTRKSGRKRMLKGIHALMEEADAICHYNGTAFDIPVLNKEFILAGMTPPAPSKDIDLLTTVRKRFRFTSSKLDYVSQALGLGRKTEHTGYQMWLDCMNGDEKAWKLMEKYNKQDVVLLEHLYTRLLPWIKNHPNTNVYDGISGCPRCSSSKMQRRGVAVAISVRYQRWQCFSCGAWARSVKDVSHKKATFQGIH